MEQKYKPKGNYRVFVRCNTFNQSKYIEDALNGFAMQQTNFPFVCLVMDDCSTDGAQVTIKAWMESECDMGRAKHSEIELSNIIIVPHKTNANCTYAFYLLKRNTWKERELKVSMYAPWREHCEYEAICEGDDYWIDSLKLQKQVDFLDAHEDYGMVHTDFDYVSGKRSQHFRNIKKDGIYFPDYLTKGVHVATLTVMYRIDVFNKLPRHYAGKGWPMGDKPLWYEFSHETKIHYIPEITAKYRVLNESASHSKDINKQIAFKKAGVEIRQFYANLWNVNLPNDGYNKKFFGTMMYYACKHNNIMEAENWLKVAKKYKLMSFTAYLFYWGSKCNLLRRSIACVKKVLIGKEL